MMVDETKALTIGDTYRGLNSRNINVPQRTMIYSESMYSNIAKFLQSNTNVIADLLKHSLIRDELHYPCDKVNNEQQQQCDNIKCEAQSDVPKVDESSQSDVFHFEEDAHKRDESAIRELFADKGVLLDADFVKPPAPSEDAKPCQCGNIYSNVTKSASQDHFCSRADFSPLLEDFALKYPSDCKCSRENNSKCLHVWELIRHDCMWAGLCVNADHRDNYFRRYIEAIKAYVPPGQSVLIANTTDVFEEEQPACNPADFFRPDTPQSDEDERDQKAVIVEQNVNVEEMAIVDEIPEVDDEMLDVDEEFDEEDDMDSVEEYDDEFEFKHDISVASVQMEAVSEPIDSEITFCMRRKMNELKREKTRIEKTSPVPVPAETTVHLEFETAKTTIPVIKSREDARWKTTLDHCYHLNTYDDPLLLSKNMESLGVQTPSDSEEEIDVVTYEKPSRPTATFPTYPQFSQQKEYQLMMDTALRQKSKQQQQLQIEAPRRPRGRPKGSTRKRTADEDVKPARRPRKVGRKPGRKSSKESEMAINDTDKRHVHNNMERTRRSALRGHFNELRKTIPSIEKKVKSPKVEILNIARNYIMELQEQYKSQCDEIYLLKKRQARLLNEKARKLRQYGIVKQERRDYNEFY